MRGKTFAAMVASLACFFTGSGGHAEPARRIDLPEAGSLWAHDNLFPWAMVPYDARKRAPEERAQLLERLGFKHFAYDWRDEHVPTFDAEIEALQRHGIDLLAWWFPLEADDPIAKNILEVFKRHDVHPQLWVVQSFRDFPKTSQQWARFLPPGLSMPQSSEDWGKLSEQDRTVIQKAQDRFLAETLPKNAQEQEERVNRESDRIRALVKLASPYGCKVALYNHVGWFAMMDNEVAIIKRLKALGVSDVGIAYNFQHARDPLHDDTVNFPAIWEKIKPYVVAVEITGTHSGPLIYPSQGDRELEMMRTIQESGWRGPVGLFGEKGGDAEITLRNYLVGFDWLAAELRQPGSAGPRPFPRALTSDGWIGSWYAAPISFVPAFDNTTLNRAFETGVASNGKTPTEFAPSFHGATLRTIVHLTAGGARLRLRFSNRYGGTALRIGAVRVAANTRGQEVTFSGQSQITLSPGDSAVSDPVNLETSAGTDLTVSVFYPESLPKRLTLHFNFSESGVNQLIPGNAVLEMAASRGAKALRATYFLTAVDVESAGSRGTIVVLADSQTGDGPRSWPALLAQRLARAGKTYGVLNASVGGNRLLRDSQIPYGGESALNRFEPDVLNQPGVRYAVLYEGVNDLAVWRLDGFEPSDPPTAAQLTEAIRGLAERAHQHGIKFYVATLTPSEGAQAAQYSSPRLNEAREELNEWIRASDEIDGYFDFDRARRDPEHPGRLKAALELGDHLHPNEAGQRAMSEAIDLSLFQ